MGLVRTVRRITIVAVLTLVAALLVLLRPGGAADAAQPSTAPSQAFLQACRTVPVTASCQAAAVADFNKARAKEGLVGLVLPSNFRALSVAKQLLILTNIERLDRSIPPITGLSSTLSGYAMAGAANHRDPARPYANLGYAANYAGTANPLVATFAWMYYDGYGSFNTACTSSSSAGCWGHRRNVLIDRCGPLLTGAAQSGAHTATDTVWPDTRDTADVLAWSAERTYFPTNTKAYAVKTSSWVRGTSTATIYRSGRTLTFSRSYSPTPTTIKYQWYASGVAVAGATGRTWTVPGAYVGKPLKIAVKASRYGYFSCGNTYAVSAVQ